MDSVTMWISRLKDSGREQAAEMLWRRYLQRLLHLARQKLGPAPRTTADEEDVVVTAFAALLSGIREDRFSLLNDRNDLWQVLIMLTERKAISQRRADWAQKRGGIESKQELPPDAEAPEPSPELAAELAEEFDQRLKELADELEKITRALLSTLCLSRGQSRLPPFYENSVVFPFALLRAYTRSAMTRPFPG